MSEKVPYTKIVKTIKKDVDYIADEAYRKGLSDAWECIKKIQDTSVKVRVEIFGDWATPSIMQKHTASEAIAKIKAYEEDQKQIRVGDEVKAWYGNAIVTRVDEKAKTANFFFKTGESGCDYFRNIERTGRHFDAVETLLEILRESEDV